MAIIEVDEENFQQELTRAFEQNKTLILKFGSEYCEPCFALEGELEDLDEEVENLSILMIDTNESPELAEKYDVYALPTMVIYRDQETVIYHKEGIILADDIAKIIHSKEK